jgi:two-component sensor histidine kinase
VNDLTLEIDQAVPCGLILNELVSNCLKHAFPDERQGRVTVMLNSSDAERVTLVVQDDGVGLPPPQCSCVPQSLGIQLIHRLAQQLGGQADLVSRNGTRAEVEFPLRSSTRGENR